MILRNQCDCIACLSLKEFTILKKEFSMMALGSNSPLLFWNHRLLISDVSIMSDYKVILKYVYVLVLLLICICISFALDNKFLLKNSSARLAFSRCFG